MKRRWLMLSLLVPLSFVLIYKGLKPSLQRSAEPFVRQILNLQKLVAVDFKEVNWSVLNGTIALTDVAVTPQDPLYPGLKAKDVSLSLSLRSLVKGSIKADLKLNELQLIADVDSFAKSKSPSKELPLQEIFNQVARIPLSSLSLTNANLLVQSTRNEYSISAAHLNMDVVFAKELWDLQLVAPDVLLDFFQLGSIPGQIDSRIRLTPNSLEVTKTKASLLKAEFIGEARLDNFQQILIEPQGLFKGTLTVPLAEFRNHLLPYRKLPELKGLVVADGQFEIGTQLKTTSGFSAQGRDLQIGPIVIGDISLNGKTQGNTAKIEELKISNSSGALVLQQSTLNWSFSPLKLNLKNKVSLENISLHEFLKNIHVGDLPVAMLGNSQLDCAGELIPDLKYTCKGQLQGEGIEVRSSLDSSSAIVALTKAQAEGEFSVTKEQVSFNTILKINDNKGTVSGVVSYSEGFDIDYETDELDFKNVKSLAGLKLQGQAKLKGSTQGHSKKGTFEIEFSGQDFYLNDFFLGEPAGLLTYESGQLDFSQLQSRVNASVLTGEVRVDLKANRIEYNLNGSRAALQDLGSIFKRLYSPPFDYNAETQISVKGSGPFKINEMTYELRLDLRQLSVANEVFPTASIQLNAIDGLVRLSKFNIAKAPFQLQGSGEILPNWDTSLKFTGKNFLVELSENIQALNKDISGRLNFEVDLQGPLQKPQIKFNSSLDKFSIGSQELQNSSVSGQLNTSATELKFQLFGNQLTGDFRIPFSQDGSDGPLKMSARAQRWSFANLFGVLGGGDLIFEYESAASGNLEITSELGQLAKASGELNVSEFSLKRDSQFLTNQGPLNAKFKDGVISINSFSLIGNQNNFAKLSGQNFTLEKLNLKLESLLELRIFHLFVPFLEELSGNSKTKVTVQGAVSKPEVFGDAQIENAFIKFKGLNAPIERLKAAIEFSLSKILINDISASVGGGSLSGDGQVLIEGARNLPTQLKLKVENATLNVPDKVRSTGKGELLLSGKWFPFVISGNYSVQEGLVTKEFQDEGTTKTLKPSLFLPKVILENSFEPILLDLSVRLDNPVQIKNSLINGSVIGQILVKGPPESPGLGGRIEFVKPSQIFFRDTPFAVQSGVVQFIKGTEINPELNLQAKARKSNYDISLFVTGESKNPVIQVSSQPPLAEKDLISLLALGITSQNIEKESQAKTEDSTSYTIGTAILANNPVAKNIQSTLGLNVQFSNEYNEIKNSSAQRVTLSRSLTERLSASASQLRGQQSSTEVKLLYSFSDSLSAIGSWQNRSASESGKVVDSQRGSESILGLDLEFKREFR